MIHGMKWLSMFIILLLPFSVLAHGLEPELRVDPGTLPGSFKYHLERLGEWSKVNFLTISTKKKQATKLALASERIAEMGPLLYEKDAKLKDLQTALARYKHYGRSAEDMAEKILFIDGGEIAVAERFEAETRLQEKFLLELLENSPDEEKFSIARHALREVRILNEKMFKYMVANYQFDENDIRKHGAIMLKHMALVREALTTVNDKALINQVNELLQDAENHRKAGLNAQGFERIIKAKNTIY